MTTAARALLCAAFLLAASSCREKAKEPSGGAGPSPAPAPSTTTTGRVTPGVAPMLVADSAGLKHYLESVDTAHGATFDVTWSPNTVRLSREETMRSLRRVSRDGETFTFGPTEPKVRDLKAGQVLLVWGIALRKVSSLENKGDAIVVHTDVAAIPEAIAKGTIAWKSHATFGQGLISPSKVIDTTKKKVSSRARSEGLFHYASYTAQEGEDQTEEGELPHHAGGEIGGYEFEVGYANAGTRLDFQLEARKSDGGAFEDSQDAQGERTRAQGTKGLGKEKEGKEKKEEEKNTKQGVGEIEQPGGVLTPKGLFGLAAEVFDLRVRVRGHLDEFDTDGVMSIADAALGNFHFNINNIQGEADLDWIARLGEKGVFSENIKVEVPFNYDIPLIIGGIPFVIEVGVNFLVTPGLTSHYASATGSYHITLAGNAGISATGSDVKTESSLTGTEDTGNKLVNSVGVSAVLVAVQLPRLGFGLGLLNTSAVAYVDHVLATSVVTAGNLALIPCRRWQINSSFGAGVGVQLLGIKIPGLSSKKTLGTPVDKVVTEPEGYNCKV